jgi:hypothetical protein
VTGPARSQTPKLLRVSGIVLMLIGGLLLTLETPEIAAYLALVAGAALLLIGNATSAWFAAAAAAAAVVLVVLDVRSWLQAKHRYAKGWELRVSFDLSPPRTTRRLRTVSISASDRKRSSPPPTLPRPTSSHRCPSSTSTRLRPSRRTTRATSPSSTSTRPGR